LIKNVTIGRPARTGITRVTDSIIVLSLLLYAAFAPHSIAVTQGAFLLGLTAWGVQLAASRRLSQPRTPIDIAIFGFFACCVLSSFFSYDPLVSLKGLKSPAFFFAFYFVCNNVRSLKFATLLAFIIIASCFVNIAASAGQIAEGRGLNITSIEQDSPFFRAGLQVGDVILHADGQRVRNLEDLSKIADSDRGRIQINYQRNESLFEAAVSRRAIRRAADTGVSRLGITASPGRNFRVTGLYSHYETYAEVLQLIAALAVGLLIAAYNRKAGVTKFLIVSVVLITTTLLLTSTRAAIAGLAVSVIVMTFASARRSALAVALLAMFILVPVAIFTIERSRGPILFDPSEGSTAYRLEIWKEAFILIKDHPILGIGKGSEAKLKERLGLYDEGRLPPGHFHSTPIQIATWWGLPALGFYFALMAISIGEAWKLTREMNAKKRWDAWGLAAGALGALIAFNVSSLVHFNFGDGEVVMMFWLLTGLLFAVRRVVQEESHQTGAILAPTDTIELHSEKNQLQELEATSESSARAAGARRNS
jgi:hypothetical protein